jgi:hypothetical protein
MRAGGLAALRCPALLPPLAACGSPLHSPVMHAPVTLPLPLPAVALLYYLDERAVDLLMKTVAAASRGMPCAAFVGTVMTAGEGGSPGWPGLPRQRLSTRSCCGEGWCPGTIRSTATHTSSSVHLPLSLLSRHGGTHPGVSGCCCQASSGGDGVIRAGACWQPGQCHCGP